MSTTFRLLGLFLVGAVLCGCSTADGPSELILSNGEYPSAFERAIEAAREAGMPATLRDRRAGIIETEPRHAGTLMEPWRSDNKSLSQAFENTISNQRRRVRFEFTPVGYTDDPINPGAPLTGADFAGATSGSIDLTTYTGDIRLRCVVTLEENHRPGTRRSTWSRRVTSQSILGGRDADLPANFWTPVGRDEAYERRMLAAIVADQEISGD